MNPKHAPKIGNSIGHGKLGGYIGTSRSGKF